MIVERRDGSNQPGNLESPRFEVSSIALAYATRKYKDQEASRARVYELTQNPIFEPKDPEKVRIETFFLASLMDYTLQNRQMSALEQIESFDYQKAMVAILTAVPQDDEEYPMDEEETQELVTELGLMMKGGILSAFKEAQQFNLGAISPYSYADEIDKVTEYANANNVTAESVFASDELYLGYRKSQFVPEKNIAEAIRAVELIRGQFLTRMIASMSEGMIEAIDLTDEGKADALSESESESNMAEVNALSQVLIQPTITIMREELKRLGGKEAALEFDKRLEQLG